MPHKAQALHCNHFRMLSFYSPFHFPLILWLNVWHVLDRILAEMVSISPNIYYGDRASRRISRSKNSKLNLVSLQVSSRCRGYSLLSFQNSEFLFSSLFCINFVVVSLTCSAFPHEMALILSTLRP